MEKAGRAPAMSDGGTVQRHRVPEISGGQARLSLSCVPAGQQGRRRVPERGAGTWRGRRLLGVQRGGAVALPALSRSPALAGMRWLGQAGEMPSDPISYPGYRFPAEVIQHAVWLY